ncbi:hypothetical protein VV01_01630 [Luteipulveratus halotolerans]|uniref:DUF4352 domain-containing protein n=2 Tax=Luteipulveratus halotolerans TaxID=1631356 RepID=A0A0L6CF55_9MICO|nr:hypothetical protein VV01_01630 [Luteipulveratus halotolerans]
MALAISGCGGEADAPPTSQAAVTVNASDDGASATPSQVGVSPFGEERSSSTGAAVTVEKPRRVSLKDDAVDHNQKYAAVRITLTNGGSSPFPSSEVSFTGACSNKPAVSPKADIGDTGMAYGPVNRYVQPGRQVRFQLVYTCPEPESLSITAAIAEGPFATFAGA